MGAPWGCTCLTAPVHFPTPSSVHFFRVVSRKSSRKMCRKVAGAPLPSVLMGMLALLPVLCCHCWGELWVPVLLQGSLKPSSPHGSPRWDPSAGRDGEP